MDPITFDNKVVVITGAGGGLGRSHALEFARRGARVVVNDLGGAVDGSGSSETAAEAVVREITDAGGEAVVNADSVATPEGGAAIIQTAIDAFGQIDVVVNNAGILRDKSFHNMTPDMVDAVLDVHLRGAFNVTLPAWLHFREQGHGAVVNTSSNAGVLGNFGQANYGAAKMGLVGFTNVLAIEGRKRNIRVNAIAPIADTRMTKDLLGPLAENLQPETITPVVVWLASDACDISGELYSCAGGMVARMFIGITEGYFNPDLTVENVAENVDKIRDQSQYDDFPDNSGEIDKLVRLFS